MYIASVLHVAGIWIDFFFPLQIDSCFEIYSQTDSTMPRYFHYVEATTQALATMNLEELNTALRRLSTLWDCVIQLKALRLELVCNSTPVICGDCILRKQKRLLTYHFPRLQDKMLVRRYVIAYNTGYQYIIRYNALLNQSLLM